MSFRSSNHLLNHKVKEDYNMFKMKNENILQKLFFMNSFNEISNWVNTNSRGQKYVANPSNASDTDRLDCLLYMQKPIEKALKGTISRKNGRDIKLNKAAKSGNYEQIANILASTARTYWLDHAFFSKKNLKNNLNALYMLKNNNIRTEDEEKIISKLKKNEIIIGLKKMYLNDCKCSDVLHICKKYNINTIDVAESCDEQTA